ncbi:MAG TPA: PH domain-containing protein [Rhodospirillaceae bacterium]|nr:PH domain-containing protein [Rhodospirillaceae bacterium]
MTMGDDDFHSEPVRGLPEQPPPGETILWQGSPLWWDLARQVFHVRLVAGYFLLLAVWRCHLRSPGGFDGRVFGSALLSVLPLALLSLALLALLAWLSSRTTVYTITSRRVVMRIGVALPLTVNIPFSVLGSAGLQLRRGGSGDIVLALSCPERIAYSNFWPHVRPWRLRHPEPMLRSIAGATAVAGLLAAAVREQVNVQLSDQSMTTAAGTEILSTSLGLSS